MVTSLFFFLRLNLFIHERQRKRQRHRQREKQALCREPDVGLDPRILGSHSESKADPLPLRHPGTPDFIYFREREREREEREREREHEQKGQREREKES